MVEARRALCGLDGAEVRRAGRMSAARDGTSKGRRGGAGLGGCPPLGMVCPKASQSEIFLSGIFQTFFAEMRMSAADIQRQPRGCRACAAWASERYGETSARRVDARALLRDIRMQQGADVRKANPHSWPPKRSRRVDSLFYMQNALQPLDFTILASGSPLSIRVLR